MQDKSETIRRDLTRGAAISFGGNVFKLAEFGLTLLAAGLFGVEVWGRYIFLNTLLMPVVRLASAGMDRGVTWYVSRHRDIRLPEGFFPWIRRRMLIAGGLLLVAASAWTLLKGKGSGSGLFDPLAFGLMAASVPFILLTNLNVALSTAFRKIEHDVLVRGILHPAFHLGLPCAAAVFTRDLSLLAGSFLLGSAAGWALSEKLAAPLRRSLDALPATEQTERATATLWQYSWPMGLRDLLLSLQQRTDIWFLALYLDPRSIGIYGLALSIANSIRTIRQAFDGILLAVIASLKRGEDASRIKDAYLHAGQTTLALQIPIFAFLVFFAEPLLRLSGPEYGEGRTALLIFASTLILIGYLGLSGTVVLGLGKSRWGVFNDLLCLALSLAFNALFIPRYGIAGAAMGMSLAILLTHFVWFGEAIYLIRRVPLKASVIGNLVLGVGFTVLAWLPWRRFGDDSLGSRAAYFGIFVVCYGPLLWALFGKPWLARRRARRAAPASAPTVG